MGGYTGIDAAMDRALTAHFIATEETDFCWEARRSQRWLGDWQELEAQDMELDRIAIVGSLEAQWIIAILLVDGEGSAHALLYRRNFESENAAQKAFETLA